MALIYRVLQVLVLGVTAAAVDDIPITWSQGTRSASLPCVVADWTRLQPRRTLPLDDERSRPKPYIWTRDGEVIYPKRVSQNGTLEVSRKSSGSEGVYQCAVQHHGGSVLGYPTHLKFSFMDKQFTSQPEDVTAWLGQPLSIPCRIGSGPAASISWTRDGVNLPRTHRYHVLENELLIIDIHREDSGLYRCVAANYNVNRSRTSHEGRVVVEASPLGPAALLPVQHERHLAAPVSARLLLPCPLLGWPRPKVVWKLVPPGGSPRRLKSEDEVLVLDKLEYNQEGVYSCLVEGQNQLSKNFSVSVSEPARVVLPPQSKEAIRASTVRFNCTGGGRPAPAVAWFKDGRPLALAGRINLRKSADRSRMELVISGVTSDDAGNYQCFAVSAGARSSSWASSWARLAVVGADAAAPGALWCAPAGGSAVALRWRPPASAGVIAYTVDTTATDERAVGTIGQPMTKTEEIVKLKEPLTPYVFQVRAYVKSSSNKNVATDMSESVVCQGQGVPIILSKLEDDKVLVSWKQFSERHPGVMQWILQYRHENYTEDEHNVTLAPHVTNYTLAAPASSPLLVRLLGSRTMEWLKQNLTLVPWTSTTSTGQDDDDGPPWSVPRDLELTEVSERGFTVRWSIDEDVYSYLVCVRASYGNDECQESYKTSATVEGLQPETDYEVRVQVRVPGRALGGAFTEPYHVTTQPEGPRRFKELSYKFVNASAVRVRWSGAPGPYTVHYSTRLQLPLEHWAALHTAGNTVLITGVDPAEQMYVMVAGYDPPAFSPLLSVPPQVEDLEAKDLKYEYTSAGVSVWWRGAGPKTVRYAQNITQPLENWSSINVTAARVEIPVPEPQLALFVMVSAGGARRHHVLTIPPRPNTYLYYYLGAGAACVLCALGAGGAGLLLRRKHGRAGRPRRTHAAAGDGAEEGSEMRVTRAHNGAAAEPLLNGHVHITENPASKTPNGRLKKGRRVETPAYDAFDLSRHDADATMETVLNDTTYNLLDTSRRPEFDVSRSSRELSANNSFHKLPDDNMNSELTRSSEFQLDNSKIHPTLQPNG